MRTHGADNLQAVSEQRSPIAGHQLEPISVCLTYASEALAQACNALKAGAAK